MGASGLMVAKKTKPVSTRSPDLAEGPVVDNPGSRPVVDIPDVRPGPPKDHPGRPVGRVAVDHWLAADEVLFELGFDKARVRRHGNVARIEVPQSNISQLIEADIAAVVAKRLHALGAAYVSVDLLGYNFQE